MTGFFFFIRSTTRAICTTGSKIGSLVREITWNSNRSTSEVLQPTKDDERARFVGRDKRQLFLRHFVCVWFVQV